MGSAQQFRRNISLMLSEVLSDVGVNDETIGRTREITLSLESLNRESLLNDNGQSFHFYGGTYDGSSTTGSGPSESILLHVSSYNVIQELADQKSDATNLLIVQDESTAPGRCLLQLLRNDVSNIAANVSEGEFYIDDKGRALLKTPTIQKASTEQHGPVANVSTSGRCGTNTELVYSFHCESWPVEARPWLDRRSLGGWPSRQLKSVCERSGYFLVPRGSFDRGEKTKISEVEWSVSMSAAERHLMHSLNITQVKCYVLMKHLLKTHINGVYDNAISSYMCKTALFYCIENTYSDVWQERSLTFCLDVVLRELYNYVQNKNCPLFIIPRKNIMTDRITTEEQQHLLENIQHIIDNKITVLFELQTDDIGVRLQQKMNTMLGNSDDVLDASKKRPSEPFYVI